MFALLASASTSPAEWAQSTFGSTKLGDPRRTKRLVRVAAALAACPGASLLQQLGSWSAAKGADRLLDTDAIDFAQIIAPHCAQTRQRCHAPGVQLLVQDTTTLDFSHHRTTVGLGPIGDGRGVGFYRQTVLAVDPVTGHPLGVLAADPWTRQAIPVDESRRHRLSRPRESECWGRLARTIGPPPTGSCWVHVADREADCFDFLAAVVDSGADVLVRIAQNRRVGTTGGTMERRFTILDACPPVDQRHVPLPPRSRPAPVEAELAIGWQAVQVRPPAMAPASLVSHPPIAAWAIRIWERGPPPEVAPIDWKLLTTVPVTDGTTAWERVQWYTQRWRIEEFHQCLKTGYAIESSQVRDAANLRRQLAIMVPLAVWLVHLRSLARCDPEAPLERVASAAMVALVAQGLNQERATTVGAFFQQIGRLDGWPGRKNDGPPGWRVLWRGWRRVLNGMEGARLAAALTPEPPTCG